MSDEYCTYLISYLGNKLPPFYIGSTSVKKVHNGYMGTICSKQYRKLWKEELFHNRHLFKIKILSFHDTRESALFKEEFLQRKLNVVQSTLYVNMAIANKHFVNFRSPMKGLKHTKETKKKISDRAKNRKYSIETREKMSRTRKGVKLKLPRSLEYRTKSSISHKKLYENGYINPRLGTKHTDETKDILSEKKSSYNTKCRWYNNGEKNSFTHLNPGEGWVLGRLGQKPSTKGYRWYNNGYTNKMFLEKPEDKKWLKGLIRTKK
jgi:hypothetical protein